MNEMPNKRVNPPVRSSPPPGHYLRQKPIEGPRFIRLVLLVSVGMMLLAGVILFLVGHLRAHYGLPGWE